MKMLMTGHKTETPGQYLANPHGSIPNLADGKMWVLTRSGVLENIRNRKKEFYYTLHTSMVDEYMPVPASII